jgi:hypothetical protein
VSTFGREADRLAELKRDHERKVAVAEIRLRDCVRFAISTLSDQDLTDHNARWTAYAALTLLDDGGTPA